MLNPRKYLEDCIRYGKMCVWGAGFPWELLDEQIDGTTFDYTATEEASRYFESQVGSSWDNLLDRSLPLFNVRTAAPRSSSAGQRAKT